MARTILGAMLASALLLSAPMTARADEAGGDKAADAPAKKDKAAKKDKKKDKKEGAAGKDDQGTSW